MLTAVVFLCLAQPIEDWEIELAPFPSRWVSKEQLECYRQHRAWLVGQRSLVGDRDGRYSGWIRETDWAILYWQTLHDCRWTGADPDLLRRLIGSERYLDAWHPPLLPGVMPVIRECIPNNPRN